MLKETKKDTSFFNLTSSRPLLMQMDVPLYLYISIIKSIFEKELIFRLF